MTSSIAAARRAKSGRAEHARRLNSNPDILRKRSETMKALWSNPEFREKQSEGMKAFYREHPERRIEKCEQLNSMKAVWRRNRKKLARERS